MPHVSGQAECVLYIEKGTNPKSGNLPRNEQSNTCAVAFCGVWMCLSASCSVCLAVCFILSVCLYASYRLSVWLAVFLSDPSACPSHFLMVSCFCAGGVGVGEHCWRQHRVQRLCVGLQHPSLTYTVGFFPKCPSLPVCPGLSSHESFTLYATIPCSLHTHVHCLSTLCVVSAPFI